MDPRLNIKQPNTLTSVQFCLVLERRDKQTTKLSQANEHTIWGANAMDT